LAASNGDRAATTGGLRERECHAMIVDAERRAKQVQKVTALLAHNGGTLTNTEIHELAGLLQPFLRNRQDAHRLAKAIKLVRDGTDGV
jgi:hypothetical protein